MKKDLKAKDRLPGYTKADASVFNSLKDKLLTAKNNADKVLKDVQRAGSDNPSTHVHKVIQKMESMAKK